ncbi:MAG TPA: flagellar hook-length control protein FliK, partial [Micropepsaceae bacterium]|nr:flagellar hook-length control protein FliK [Micropepsaceae bacterium]
LGSIGVRLEFNGDGQMRAMLAADRVEALELLRRDAPELMRMMREAGIDLAGNGLSFSLEDGRNGAGQHRETHALLREQGFAPVRAALESEIEAALSPYLPTRALDISI